MPLLITALTSAPGLPGAGSNADLPNGNVVAQVWAAAVGAWAVGIIPPSAAVAAAQTALQSTLEGLFSTPRSQPAEVAALANAMNAAHLVFATTVGTGMVGFVPVPPVSPLNFAAILQASPRDDSQLAANEIANMLDAWMRTGISTMIAPPNTPVPWS
jgi:hypothetical protein